MAKTVRIRLKSNPEVTRTVTERSWANYPKNKYELVDAQPIQVETKKKVVENAASNITAAGLTPIVELIEKSDIAAIHDDLAVNGEFVNPVGEESGDLKSELETLREQYQAKFGKPADGRMKEEKLKQLVYAD